MCGVHNMQWHSLHMMPFTFVIYTRVQRETIAQ